MFCENYSKHVLTTEMSTSWLIKAVLYLTLFSWILWTKLMCVAAMLCTAVVLWTVVLWNVVLCTVLYTVLCTVVFTLRAWVGTCIFYKRRRILFVSWREIWESHTKKVYLMVGLLRSAYPHLVSLGTGL